MHATDAARREYFDPGALSNPACGSYSCGPIPFLRRRDGQIANANLPYVCLISDEADLVFGEPDAKLAGEYGDGCGDATGFLDDLFEAARGFDILRPRQPVSDYS